MLPRIANIIKWIESELDEEAREDFYRIKKVTDNKKKLKQEEFEEMAKFNQRQEEKADEDAENQQVIPNTDDLGFDQDEDEDLFV